MNAAKESALKNVGMAWGIWRAETLLPHASLGLCHE